MVGTGLIVQDELERPQLNKDSNMDAQQPNISNIIESRSIYDANELLRKGFKYLGMYIDRTTEEIEHSNQYFVREEPVILIGRIDSSS